MVIEQNTEQKILEAAEKVFLQSGYDGARMQEIADVAGINKAMLHYYFRSKDALFGKIFDEKVKDFFPEIVETMQSDALFIDKVDVFIEKYINLMCKYPFIPFFVLSTVNKSNSEAFIKKLPTQLIQTLAMSYMLAEQNKEVKTVNPFQFIISVISLCAFPFVARPIFQTVGQIQMEDFKILMQERIPELKMYVRLILNP